MREYLSAAYAAAAFCLLSAPSAAQSPEGQGEPKAGRLVTEAADAMGGRQALLSLGWVRRTGTDDWVDTLQQKAIWRGPPDPRRLPVGDHIGVSLYIDYARPEFVRTQHFDDGPGDQFTQVDVGGASGGFGKGRFHEEPFFFSSSSPEDSATARANELKRLPEALVRLALEQPAAVKWVGERKEGGRLFDVVSITDPKMGENLLYLDHASHLPAKAEFRRDHPILGDTTAEAVYLDYRAAGSLRLPYAMILRVGGVPTHIYRYSEVTPGAAPPAELLERPAAFVRVVDPPAAPTLRDLGGGVYEILGSSNVMFAVFSDHVILCEAPQSEDYVLKCLDLIASVAPGKPVTAVASHFHADHIAGARTLVARGIPIIAMPETAEMVRKAAAARKTIKPDLLSASPAKPRIIPAKSRMKLVDESQEVDLFDVGPTQHVNHLLVAYFPKAKALHVADLWDVPAPEQAIGGNDAALLWSRVRKLGLDVELMVPVHGNPVTRTQMERGLSIRSKYLPVASR